MVTSRGATPSSSPESTSGALLLPLAWLALVMRGMFSALPRSRPGLASLPFIVSDLDKRDENRMLTRPNRRMCPGHKDVPRAQRAPCNRRPEGHLDATARCRRSSQPEPYERFSMLPIGPGVVPCQCSKDLKSWSVLLDVRRLSATCRRWFSVMRSTPASCLNVECCSI